jgi:hypothetical protein
MRKRIALLLLFPAIALAQNAHYRHHGAAILPDARVTPGTADPHLTESRLCSPAFRTRSSRNVDASQKRRACRNYGITRNCPGPLFEIDHLISIELGGSNDIYNLWPQPVDRKGLIGFHAKDRVENAAHRAVCNGTMTLEEAQYGISHDWYAFGLKHGFLSR